MADSSKICHKNVEYGHDEPSMVLRDLDGSLTGTPGVSVAAIAPYYQDGIDCEVKSEWNMGICNGNFARVIMESIYICFSICFANQKYVYHKNDLIFSFICGPSRNSLEAHF